MTTTIKVEKSITIKTSPEKVTEFFLNLDKGDNYLNWHPKDHRKFEFIRVKPEIVDSTFRFVEFFGNQKIDLKCVITEYEEGRNFTFRSLSKIVKFGGRFTMKSTENGIEVTQMIYVKMPLIVEMIAKILGKYVSYNLLSRHVEEEMENMKKILENT